MNELKEAYRRRLKIARLKLTNKERLAKSQQIEHRLSSLVDFSSISRLHIFQPISALNEVDISGLTERLKTDYPKLDLFTSQKLGSAWQITPLAGVAKASSPCFDMIIVPMLGFDSRLYRLGYGGGYYDTLLSRQPQARKIGVCFEEGKIDRLPVEAHDVALEAIVTEAKIYR